MSDLFGGGARDWPIHFEAAGATYAGTVRVIDVDEDERVAGVHAQARALRGWAGVTAAVAARPDDRGGYALDADVQLSGTATREAGDALLAAVRDGIGAPASLADDPAWRRKLALRAALAVGVGVAAGLAGAAWDRRRRE
ncbi:MAG: hypothetical protein QOH72_1589 [Solirubrobacteraceae bacterium]|jgi:hypothetical protein|nr:hypothetical protein [Solirubrobacteraceae bacterium]